MVDGGHPTIKILSYLAKILEKGCQTWPDNRGCTVYASEYSQNSCQEVFKSFKILLAEPYLLYVSIERT